jgi:hypothetical protein
LDANLESLHARKPFDIPDLKLHVRQHRAQLLVDALTIIRAYIDASMPRVGRALESFETWSRVARDPLIWLDEPDAAETQELETDDELGPLQAAYCALTLSPAIGTKKFSAAMVETACTGFSDDRKALCAAIEAAGCSDAKDSTRVGYWLRAHRDVVAGSWKLHRKPNVGGVAQWQFVNP